MLLDKLQARQSELALTDTQFAARLGISCAQWQSIGYGRRRISEIVLRGVLNEFPELQQDVLFYLGLTGTEIPETGTVDSSSDLAEVAG